MANSESSLRSVPFKVDDPERIPAKRYYDEEFYKLELEHLWPHVWQMACRLEQIPEVGDWVEYQNLGRSVIVVRTNDGIKAYHNACRHRGVPFAGGSGYGTGNCKATGFVCPFHGWRWNMDGDNTLVYGRGLFSERQLDPEDLKLRQCRVETAIGCAFINYDDNAPGLRESIGPLLDRLDEHKVDQLRMEWWYGTELPANWKVAMEAFMEGYHVMKTHPQLQRATPMLYDSRYCAGEGRGTGLPVDRTISSRENVRMHLAALELTGEGMGGMIQPKEIEIARSLVDMDLPEDQGEALMTWFGTVQAEITTKLRARGEPVPDLNAIAATAPLEGVEFVFPHYFLLPSLTSFSSYRVRPTGPETCFFELYSLTMYPPGEEPDVPTAPTILPYNSPEFPAIPQQDYANIPIQQIGVHAPGFEFMRLAKHIEGLVSNYQRVIDGYLAGVAPDKLAKATNVLGGNFDGQIEDIGF